MSDIASIAEVIHNVNSDEHGDLIEHGEKIDRATLTDLCDLIESGSEEEKRRLAFLVYEAMEKPLPPGMFKGPHYDCERNAARLQREKQLLHERVEELEGRPLEISGCTWIPTHEYESIKADAEKWRQYQKGLAGGLPHSSHFGFIAVLIFRIRDLPACQSGEHRSGRSRKMAFP